MYSHELRVPMKKKIIAVVFLAFAAALSCNLPVLGGMSPSNEPNTPAAMGSGTPTPYDLLAPSITALSAPSIAAPALDLLPADLPFYIDCTALDPSRQADCETYIAATRDRVYPLLRELTGISLAGCYDAVYYTIVPDAQLSEFQGWADQNRITYSLRASLNAAPAPLHDAHELLHTIDFCNGALDQHIFHGAFESYIDLTLTGVEWQSPGRERIAEWLETKLLPDLQKAEEATPAPGAGVSGPADACVEIYGDLVTILYYDSGIETVAQLYRATINPRSENNPHPRLLTLFGPTAGIQFQVVVNALKQNPKYRLTVPECGME